MATKTRTQILVHTALLAALTALISPFTIPIGPIPLSLGVFAVFLSGAMLPPMAALASQAVYVLLGMVGLPVFTGFRGGLQALAGPTGGYIAGYFILVLATALAVRHTGKYWLRLLTCVGALALFYTAGTLWYMLVAGVSFLDGLVACVIPFILPDTIKAALALWLAQALRHRLGKG